MICCRLLLIYHFFQVLVKTNISLIFLLLHLLIQFLINRRSTTLQRCVTCPDEIWLIFGDHCYLFVNNPISWSNARDTCESFSGDLVEIDNDAEFSFLKSFIGTPNVEVWVF